MAIAYESVSFGEGTAAGVTLTEPTGASQNDFLLLTIIVGGAATSLTRPTDWTNRFNGTSPEATFDFDVSWIIRGAGAPNLDVTWTGSVFYEYHVLRFSGVDTTTPIDANGSFTTAFSGVPDPPAVTPATTDAMAIALAYAIAGADAGGWVAPTNYTIGSNNATGRSVGVAYRQLASGDSENPGAFGGYTDSGSNIGQGTFTLTTASGGVALAPSVDDSATAAEGVTMHMPIHLRMEKLS